MPKGYAHLTYDQRCQIFTLKKRNLSQQEIARLIGSSQLIINRKLARNSGKKDYRYNQANEKAFACSHKVSSVKHKMIPSVLCLVEKMLRNNQFSPDQISNQLKITSSISIIPFCENNMPKTNSRSYKKTNHTHRYKSQRQL